MDFFDDMSEEECAELKETHLRSLETMRQAVELIEEDNDPAALAYLQSYFASYRTRAQNELMYQCGKTDVRIQFSKLGDRDYVLDLGKRMYEFLQTLPYDIILQLKRHELYLTSDYPLPQAALRSDQDDLELSFIRGIGD